jgi:hypothetical protein
MKAKTRVILEQAIGEGATIGYRRSFKHLENPTEGAIIDNIQNEIMNYIDMYFDFDDNE